MDVYRVAGMPPPWHGLTLTPHYTWNAVFFLLAPLSALLLTLSLKPPQIRSVLAILIGLAILNAAIGILQSLGTPLLHFYEVTNREFAVGLLANRNHAAVSFACTLPLLATCTAAKGNGQAGWPMGILVAMIAALLLVPLIMLTGSRAGLAWVALALPMTLWVCGHEAGAGRLAAASPWIGAVAVLVVAAIFLVEERAPALLRLAQTGGGSELRLNAVPTIWKAIGDYWPWGSGIGSFPEIYAIYEPSHLLGLAHLNHAHNDLLELLLTGGLPAMLLVAAGGASLVRAAVSASRTSSPGGGEADAPAWARAGMSIVILLSLASLFDYPVRTPALAVLLAVAAALVARRNPPPPDINGAVHHDPSELPSVRRRGAYPRGADRPTVRNPA